MLRPMPIEPVPPETARVARAAFSKGHRYLRLADELDTLFTDEAFLALFPRVGARLGLPGNWRSQRSSNSPKGSPIAKRRMPYYQPHRLEICAASGAHRPWVRRLRRTCLAVALSTC